MKLGAGAGGSRVTMIGGVVAAGGEGCCWGNVGGENVWLPGEVPT